MVYAYLYDIINHIKWKNIDEYKKIKSKEEGDMIEKQDKGNFNSGNPIHSNGISGSSQWTFTKNRCSD